MQLYYRAQTAFVYEVGARLRQDKCDKISGL